MKKSESAAPKLWEQRFNILFEALADSIFRMRTVNWISGQYCGPSGQYLICSGQ